MISLPTSGSEAGCRRVLYLSMDRLTVYQWNGQESLWPFQFDVTAVGQRHFGRYVRETPRINTRLLVDLVQEEFRQDFIPHVSASDRDAIICRKRRQLFSDTPYFHAELQGREDKGRRDDVMLYSALTNPSQILPWVKLLMDTGVPLAGTCSVPQLTAFLLDRLPGNPQRRLVVSMQSVSGLRLSFYLNGKLQTSRLVDLPLCSLESCAGHIHSEVEIMLRYLNTLHLPDSGQPLAICYLTGPPVTRDLQRMMTDTPLVMHHFVDVSALAAGLGLHAKIAAPFCDQVFVYLLLARMIPNYYATRDEMRFHRQRHANRIVHTAGTGLICAGLLWGSVNFLDGSEYRRLTAVTVQKAGYFDDLNQAARKNLPELKIAPPDLKSLSSIAHELQQLRVEPFDMLRLISKGMDQFPMIELEQIMWSTNVDSAATAADTIKVSQSVTGIGAAMPEINDGRRYQMATLHGYIHPFTGDYRRALDTIDAFTAALRNGGRAYDVTVLSLPLDVGPETSLEGNTTAAPGEARFSIRIILVMPDER